MNWIRFEWILVTNEFVVSIENLVLSLNYNKNRYLNSKNWLILIWNWFYIFPDEYHDDGHRVELQLNQHVQEHFEYD